MEDNEMERMKLSDYDMFWDNGCYVAVRTGPDGVRRNIAPYNCQMRRDLLVAAREDRDALNAARFGKPVAAGICWLRTPED